jgi:hypothetical protein
MTVEVCFICDFWIQKYQFSNHGRLIDVKLVRSFELIFKVKVNPGSWKQYCCTDLYIYNRIPNPNLTEVINLFTSGCGLSTL